MLDMHASGGKNVSVCVPLLLSVDENYMTHNVSIYALKYRFICLDETRRETRASGLHGAA